MGEKSIVLVGNPDSGKSNYVGRIWLALKSRKFDLYASKTPENIKYIEDLVEYLLKGSFAPRTDREDGNRDFKVFVKSIETGAEADISVPDVSGEIWKKAVSTFEIPERWLTMLRSSSGALLFVRVHSDLNTRPLDWVSARELLAAGLVDNEQVETSLPTQVSLVELLRFLEDSLVQDGNELPKVAVIVTAWDGLHPDEQKSGPLKYLEKEFPMFAGRLSDTRKLNIKVFGASIFGGDFNLPEFAESYFEGSAEKSGYVVCDNNGNLEIIDDITTPIGWLLGRN